MRFMSLEEKEMELLDKFSIVLDIIFFASLIIRLQSICLSSNSGKIRIHFMCTN